MTRPRLQLVPAPDVRLSEHSDDALMLLAQAGARDAFAVLVERHAAKVVSVCSSMLGDGALGLELAQDTWLRIWAQRQRYRSEGKFYVWLITTARNCCRNQLRHVRVERRHAQTQGGALPTAAVEPVERLLEQERRRAVREELMRLPQSLREALLLRFAHGLRYEQMAEVLGVREPTLRSHVHRGLELLRQQLEKRR